MKPLIVMENIKKRFAGVLALDNITFDLYPGEVHVLIGENGAGKSTLIKILSGVYTPTEGVIKIDGITYQKMTTKQAQNLGISVIFQELSVISTLSIAENLFVGRLPQKKFLGFFPILDKKKMLNLAQSTLERVGLVGIDPMTLVSDLSISQKQLVEIAKSLVSNARILVMDEPTSSLNNKEIENLFAVIKSLQQEGVGIIYISHKLRELKEIGDRITIIKDGKTVITSDANSLSDDDIVSHMVGRELSNLYYNKEFSNTTDEVVFEVQDMERSDRTVKGVSFELHKGEILGFSGLVGAGRTELMEAIFGSKKKSNGRVLMEGKDLIVKNPYTSIKNGLGMITENRRETGFMNNFEIYKNIIMAKSSKDSKLGGLIGLVKTKQEKKVSQVYKKSLNIKCISTDQMITELSGGNQQKVIIGKWLAADSKVLIFDEPTRGIDVGAKNEIYKIMRSLADDGKGIIMISSELPELLSVCDRIFVMGEGKIKGELNAYDATEEKIMKIATAEGV